MKLWYSLILMIGFSFTIANQSLKAHLTEENLDTLPTETVWNIIKKIPDEEVTIKCEAVEWYGEEKQSTRRLEAILSLRATNRRFAGLMSDKNSSLQMRLPESVRYTYRTHSSAPKTGWEKISPYLPPHVSFEFSPEMDDLKTLVHFHPGIQSLEFSAYGIDSEPDYTILTVLASLTRLDISYASNLYDAAFFTSLTQLQHLRIVEDPHLSNFSVSFLREIPPYNNSLENFSSLSPMTQLCTLEITDKNLTTTAPFMNMSYLTSLNLSGSYNLEQIDHISSLINLKTLVLKLTPIIDLSPITGLTSLTKLDLSITEIPHLDSLTTLQNLRELDLDDNEKIKDAQPLSYLTNLEVLNLSSAPIKNFSFLRKLMQLKSLSVRKNFAEKTNILKEISKTLPKLKISRVLLPDDDGYRYRGQSDDERDEYDDYRDDVHHLYHDEY